VLRGHDDQVVSLSFAPDGQRLASTSFDGTALVWDLAGPPARLSAEGLNAAWYALAGDDAAAAYRAVLKLAGDPGRAVPLLRERLRPAPTPDPKRIVRLIADLDSDTFAVRDGAARELGDLGDLTEPALREALAGGPTPEVRRRVERLLEDAASLAPGRLRQVRVVEVLEYAGTPEARRLLEELAGGAPEARLTREAQAALGRLDRRPPADP
jgi:hypothetical protein